MSVVAGVEKRAPAGNGFAMASAEPERNGEHCSEDAPTKYLCPICRSDDVADVTTESDLLPVGLCANGHLALLRHLADA
jgi:hypothetical protein